MNVINVAVDAFGIEISSLESKRLINAKIATPDE